MGVTIFDLHGYQWYKAMDNFDPNITWKITTTTGTGCSGGCPECGEPWQTAPVGRCTCPTHIYIPPGQHIHVDCDLHGRVRLNGPNITW